MPSTDDICEDLPACYLYEARSCLKACAYRMAITAAATAVHLALYCTLLNKRIYTRRDKAAGFEEVIQKAEKEYPDIICKVRRLQRARNAVIHTEVGVTTKVNETTEEEMRVVSIEKEKRHKNTPNTKIAFFTASMVMDYEALAKGAKQAIEIAEEIFKKFGIMRRTGDACDIKRMYEEMIRKMTGRDVDLEDLSGASRDQTVG